MKESHTITIDECQRQALLLSMAHTTVERPGWEYLFTEIAKLMDNLVDGKPQLYTKFLTLRRERVTNSLPEMPTDDTFKQSMGCNLPSAFLTEHTGTLKPVSQT